MTFMMGFLLAVFVMVIVSFMGYMAYKHREVKFEIESSDFIAKVRAMEVERKNSCLVLFPETDQQRKFFHKMLQKGIIRENPLSTGGYILNDSYKHVWKDYAGFEKKDVVHVNTSIDVVHEGERK